MTAPSRHPYRSPESGGPPGAALPGAAPAGPQEAPPEETQPKTAGETAGETPRPPHSVRPVRIRRFLRGGSDDPRWARPALWAVLVLAALLYTWSLSANGTANSYYSAAVLAGTQSWKAFFFGALDAGSFITVDKPPLSLWAMALSARIFGFSSWSVLLPQAVAGVAAVGVLHATVRRAFAGLLGTAGAHAAALVSALVLTLTPITVAINRDNNPDTLLVLLLILGAWALQRAVQDGRLGPLLLSAVFVGLAFNTKMLQAFVVVPAFVLVYLISGPGLGAVRGLPARIGRLLLAGAVLAVSSFWWMLIVDRWPAGSRPYIGGSTNNTVWDLVIGYNGLGRIFGADAPGAGGGGGRGASFGGQAGAGRLFNDILGGQISWLIPFAVISLVIGLILVGRRPRTDPARASLLLWGGWLAVHFVVFSFAQGTFHPYYATALAPAIGALTGAGGVLMFQAGRRSRRWAWALPAALVGTAGWSFVLLRRTPDWQPWLPWAVLGGTVVAVVLLAGALLWRPSAPGAGSGRTGARLQAVGVAAALAGALAGPAAYAVSAAGSRTNGTNPLAGPSSGSGFGGPGGPGGMPPGARPPDGNRAGDALPGGFPGGAQAGRVPPGGSFGGAPGTVPGGAGGAGSAGGMGGRGGPEGTDAGLVSYLTQNQGKASWLAAVGSAQTASSIMLQTRRPVIAMGGFTGGDPAMTPEKLAGLVASGRLRFVLLGGRGPGGGGDARLTTWVQSKCTAVPASAYSSDNAATAGSGTTPGSGTSAADGAQNAQQLYRCG